MSVKFPYGRAALLSVGLGLSACSIPTHDTIPSARADAPLGSCSVSTSSEPVSRSLALSTTGRTAPVGVSLRQFFLAPSHRLSVTPGGNGASATVMRTAAVAVAPSNSMSASALADVLTPQIETAVHDPKAAEARHSPELVNNPVVKTVMSAITARKLSAFRSAVQHSSETAVMSLLDDQSQAALGPASGGTVKVAMTEAIDRVAETHKPRHLTFDDFKDFYEKTLSPRARENISRVVHYETYYFTDSFVDRFGGKPPSASFSLTVSDEDIAGALSALLESIADDIFPNTPVWVHPKKPVFYPGNNDKMPSALAFKGRHGKPEDVVKLAEAIVLPDPNDPGKPMCGMTELKAKALMYLSGKASVWAKGQSGLLVGLIGGTNLGLPVAMGKFSIGDNKTLLVIVQTVLAFTARRAAYEAAWPLLYQIDQSKYPDLEKILDVVVFKPKKDDKAAK